MKKTKYKLEKLFHFNCRFCKKWWTIADIPKRKKIWHCPWCGQDQSK